MEGRKIAKISFIHCSFCWCFCHSLDDKVRHESLFCDVAKKLKKGFVTSEVKSSSIEGFGKLSDDVTEKVIKNNGGSDENHRGKKLNKEEMGKFNNLENGLVGEIGSRGLFEGDDDVDGAPYTVVVEAVEVSRLEVDVRKRKLDVILNEYQNYQIGLYSKELEKDEANFMVEMPLSRQEHLLFDKNRENYFKFLKEALDENIFMDVFEEEQWKLEKRKRRLCAQRKRL